MAGYEVHLEAADYLLSMNRVAEAAELYAKVLGVSRFLSPGPLFAANNNLGVCYLLMGQLPSAIDVLNAAILIRLRSDDDLSNPLSSHFYEPIYNKGLVFLKMGYSKNAIKAFQCCLATKDQELRLSSKVGMARGLVAMEELLEAGRVVHSLLREAPGLAAGYLLRGYLHLEMEQDFAAIADFRIATKLLDDAIGPMDLEDSRDSGDDLAASAMGELHLLDCRCRVLALQAIVSSKLGRVKFLSKDGDVAIDYFVKAHQQVLAILRILTGRVAELSLLSDDGEDGVVLATVAPSPEWNRADRCPISHSSGDSELAWRQAWSVEGVSAFAQELRLNVALVLLAQRRWRSAAEELQKLSSTLRLPLSDNTDPHRAYMILFGYGASLLCMAVDRMEILAKDGLLSPGLFQCGSHLRGRSVLARLEELVHCDDSDASRRGPCSPFGTCLSEDLGMDTALAIATLAESISAWESALDLSAARTASGDGPDSPQNVTTSSWHESPEDDIKAPLLFLDEEVLSAWIEDSKSVLFCLEREARCASSGDGLESICSRGIQKTDLDADLSASSLWFSVDTEDEQERIEGTLEEARVPLGKQLLLCDGTAEPQILFLVREACDGNHTETNARLEDGLLLGEAISPLVLSSSCGIDMDCSGLICSIPDLASAGLSTAPPATSGCSSPTESEPSPQTHPLRELLYPGPYPPGTDIARREVYLANDEFEKCFKMSKESFRNLAKWKQVLQAYCHCHTKATEILRDALLRPSRLI